MLRRLLGGGLIGGFVGGLLVALVQTVTTTPLILHAETFESGHPPAAAESTEMHAGGLGDTHEGSFRLMTTAVATVGVAVGYAWILLAAMHAAGRPITARTVVPWAVAAFLATGLAPAFGLAPALPGSAEAGLVARQVWWLATAAATAAGLAAIGLGRKPSLVALGLMLIVLPHLVGAPHTGAAASRVPAEVAASFTAASLGLQFLTWVLPAAIAGYCVSCFGAAGLFPLRSWSPSRHRLD
jgi:cobalt transporter subunit CbtA